MLSGRRDFNPKGRVSEETGYPAVKPAQACNARQSNGDNDQPGGKNDRVKNLEGERRDRSASIRSSYCYTEGRQRQ